VSPEGTPSGDGSFEHPWDLATALAHPAAVRPGDTIRLRGGRYEGSFTSTLAGVEGARITLRSYPGEWAVIDGGPSSETTLDIHGDWATYRDFEVTNSNRDRWGDRPDGVRTSNSAHVRLVNLVIHDVGANMFTTPGLETEVYGCLIYNNGFDDSDRAHGHGAYVQNLEGTKRLEDNVIFNNYSYGIHAYAEAPDRLEGLEFRGNIWFGNGTAALGTGTLRDNCLVGGSDPAGRVTLAENLGWAATFDTRSVRLGYASPDNRDVTLVDNYFVGATDFARPWASVTMAGNTFLGVVEGIDPASHPDNTYSTERPAGATVFVRPNRYEPGRAHVAVYNWDLAETVAVDLGGILTPGASYEVRNAQDYFAGPVVRGTYDGAPVPLPMTGLAPAQPVGSDGAIEPSECTGREFNVFVVRRDPGACPGEGVAHPVPRRIL
jgi:hypothetical protein